MRPEPANPQLDAVGAPRSDPTACLITASKGVDLHNLDAEIIGVDTEDVISARLKD